MNKLIYLIALAPIFAQAQVQNLAYNGCQYTGEVAQNKPHGKGAFTCPDGRQYTGEFKNGQLHGKGQYIAPSNPNVLLAPFGLRSGQVKSMVLQGKFQQDSAQGTFKVFDKGEHVFNMTFEKGILKNISLPKK